MWLAKEAHCTGPQGIAKPCDKEKTLVLSGGDSFSGSPISTLFQGEPMAEAMGSMGYVATAFGNKDLDFGREQFAKNREAAKVTYLGANVEVQNPEWKNLEMKPFQIVERGGAKIGIIGLSSPGTKARAMADRFYGLEFKPIEETLASVVPATWKAGADAVVVIAHECPDKLKPLLEKHADWKISFVGGANCDKTFDDRAAGATLLAPDKRLSQYARAELTIDLSKPQKERVTGVEAKAVDVVDGPAEPKLAELVGTWKKKLDGVLGEEIGHTEKGVDGVTASKMIVTRAWREQLKVDVALINKKGVEALPAGPISKASVYTMMPFDNSVLLLDVKGADLQTALENAEAVVSGATKEGKTWKIGGKPLDLAATYKVATVEYLYFGGDDFKLQQADPEPTETGMDWRTPVTEWLQQQKTTQKEPLEKKLK
ncbi:bifunctional metallophosphatase/5'-nucleotidase [Chondromyces apiculatus]|uniref:2', 3'-cyclic nucleotide 2'-phosphodiesterase, putative n=1 Tax=Chondromyces apiculatus DSM 436 TaxID=1192034 RepID=A0A017TDP0_9BACT|nr:5'-nucleotidase C-terminal domain-containing protein [Chondromyces apiculatus]EYF07364.1 2', 3'-cyclic nucleotide 2'-phosphodiesterase, putative [Chondromyces apiculatus DSM 436]